MGVTAADLHASGSDPTKSLSPKEELAQLQVLQRQQMEQMQKMYSHGLAVMSAKGIEVTLEGAPEAGFDAEHRLLDVRSGGATPLWITAKACSAGRLGSVPIDLVLRCSGGSTRLHSVDLPLKVDCSGGDEFRSASLLPMRQAQVTESYVLVGSRGTGAASFFLSTVSPTPRSLAPVLLSEKGVVVKRYPAAFTRSEDAPDEVRVSVNLPTSKMAPAQLAFEAVYVDGSRALTLPATVQVLTPEAKSARDRKFMEGSQAFTAFMERVKASGHGCRDLPVFVAWLRAQPEVLRADVSPGGLSWMLVQRPVPVVFHCDGDGH